MADPFRTLAWDDFRLVKAVAAAGGLTGAAAALGIAHSTAFRRLGQIEERLGTLLFERHRTGYAATPAGEEMVALAERSMAISRPSPAASPGRRSSPRASCGSRPARPCSCIS